MLSTTKKTRQLEHSVIRCCRGEGNSGDGGDFGANTDTVAQGDNGGFSLGVGDDSAGGTTGGMTGGCDGGGGGGGGTGVSKS